MFWVVALSYVRVPRMNVGGLFKTIPIPSFMWGIASVALGYGPGNTALIDSLAVAQRPVREMLHGMGECSQYCLEPGGQTASS